MATTVENQQFLGAAMLSRCWVRFGRHDGETHRFLSPRAPDSTKIMSAALLPNADRASTYALAQGTLRHRLRGAPKVGRFAVSLRPWPSDRPGLAEEPPTTLAD